MTSTEPAPASIVWLFMLTLPRHTPCILVFRTFPNHEDLARGIRTLDLKTDSRRVDKFMHDAIAPAMLKTMPERLEKMAGALKAPILERRLPDGTGMLFQRCVLHEGGAVAIVRPKGVLP